MKKQLFALLILFSSLMLQAQDTIRLDLKQCRDMALQCSYDLQHSENSLRQAELTRKAARTNYFPQIEGSATGIYAKDISMIDGAMGNIDLIMQGAYICGFQLVQPLFTGGKIHNGHKLAKVGVDVAKEQRRMTRAQTIADVESAYWTYVAVLGKVQLLDEYKNNLETLREQVDSSVAVGMATDYDQMQVRAAYSNILYQLKRAQSGATLCRMSLSRMTGIDHDSLFLLPDTTINLSDAVTRLDSDISRRPEFQMMNLRLRVSELQVKMTRAEYLPTVGVAIRYSWLGNIKMKGGFTISQLGYMPFNPPMSFDVDKNFKTDLPMLMLSVSVPISKWWEGRYNIKKARLDVENSRLELERNKELMRLEIEQAVLNLEEGLQLIEASKQALEAATEQHRVAQNRYDVRLTSLSDLLDAQNKLQQAKSDYLEARTQYLIYHTKYLRIIGQLE